MLLLFSLETLRTQGLCNHLSFSFSFRSVTPCMDHATTSPLMFRILLLMMQATQLQAR